MLSKLLTKHGIALLSFYLILFVNYLVFLPIIIYHLRQFWRFRRSEVIKKRRPGLVVLIVVFLIIYILIFRSWTTYGDVLYPSLDDLSARPSYHHYTFSIFLSYFLYFIALLILIRSWFVYYDWQRNAQLLSLQWKKLLKYNSSIIRLHNPWTLTCRPYLGNMQFLISCAIFLFFITELIVIVTSWNYNPMTYIMVQIIMNIFIGISAIILFHQSLKLKDCIGIRAEIGVIVTLFVVLAVCYIPIILFFPELSYERTLLVYSLYSLISFIVQLRMIKLRWLLGNVAFGVRTIRRMKSSIHSIQNSFTGIGRRGSISGESSPPSTPLPPILPALLSNFSDRNTASNNNQRPRAESYESNASSIGHHLKMHHNNKNSSNFITNDELPKLYRVLSDKIGFELFAAHLIKELAVENILFLIELFELKEALIENGYLLNMDNTIKWKIDIINDFILPLTAIDSTMNNVNMTQKFIDFQCYLYNQYIATNSNYTINVKSRTRAKISNWINTNYDILYDSNINIKEKELNLLKEEEKEKVNNNNNDNDNDNDNDNNIEKQKHKLIEQLFILLHDKAGKEVYLLLSLDSYYRFSQTTQFKAWHELTNGVVIDDEDD